MNFLESSSRGICQIYFGNPTESSFDELVQLVHDHISTIVQCFHFNSHIQRGQHNPQAIRCRSLSPFDTAPSHTLQLVPLPVADATAGESTRHLTVMLNQQCAT